MRLTNHSRNNIKRSSRQATKPERYGNLMRPSYHQSSAAVARGDGQKDLAQKTGPKSRRRLLAVIIVLIVIGILELPVSSKPNLHIVSGASTVPPTQVTKITNASEQIFRSSIFNRTKLTLNEPDFSRRLRSEFPAIGRVSISLSLFSYKPTVSLYMSQPALILDTASGKYAVNDEGQAISSVSGRAANNNLEVVNSGSNSSIKLGAQVLPVSYVKFIAGLWVQLRANGLEVSEMKLPPGTAELDVYFKNTKYAGKFNLMAGYKQQAGAFVAASKYLGKQGKAPAEYVDVRVPGRAYYK